MALSYHMLSMVFGLKRVLMGKLHNHTPFCCFVAGIALSAARQFHMFPQIIGYRRG